jgi:hypothetical protein
MMNHPKTKLFCWILMVCSSMLIFGCSKKPVFQVNYSLPQAAVAYPDKKVYVSASDGRSVSQFLTPAAASELKNFPDLFSLVVLKSEGVGDLVGAYEIVPLMSALSKERLKASEVAVATTPDTAITRLEIILKSFQLDYAKRKWMASMSLEAVASGPDGSTSRQRVNGSAERVKVWGNNEAEALVSELVSDMINRLELERLLTP